MLPSTTRRVALHTSDCVNAQIRAKTELSIAHFAGAGHEAIDKRIAALDNEWDIERALEANAATASLFGLTLGAVVDRKWFLLPAVVGGFLLMHAVQGWCPPLPILRRLGFRTQTEIDYERYALKALRGDFQKIQPVAEHDNSDVAHQALDAVER